MPELIAVLSYETGIRLTQAFALLSDDQDSYAFEIEAALLRLESSASRFCDHLRDSSSRLALIAKGCADTWSAHLSGGCNIDQAAGLQQRLFAVRDHHIEFLGRSQPGILNWFRLGLAIADGDDLSWSDGRLESVPRDYPAHVPPQERLPFDRLVFVDPVPANWQWRDPNLIDQLLALVNSSWSQLFHDVRVLAGADCGHFEGLDFKRFWGWHAVEFGLAALAEERVAPHWDQQTRSLYLGQQLVHTYARETGNQIDVLQAFQAVSWADRISCPPGLINKIRPTINDLNRGPVGIALRFTGGIQGVSWELNPATER